MNKDTIKEFFTPARAESLIVSSETLLAEDLTEELAAAMMANTINVKIDKTIFFDIAQKL